MRINVRHIAVLLGIKKQILMEFSKELKLACENFKNAENIFNSDVVDIFSWKKIQSTMTLCRGMLKIESNCNVIVIYIEDNVIVIVIVIENLKLM